MKVLLAHPAQQHSYQLATGLEKSGILHTYVTTVYYKKGNCTYLTALMLKGAFKKRAEYRVCNSIDQHKVKQYCEIPGLLKLLSLNIKPFRKYYKKLKYFTADKFAQKVAKYAIKNNIDVVITYDDTSPLLFEILEKQAPNIIRITDMSAANLLYMREIYEKDEILAPQFASRLRSEREVVWDPFVIDRTKREIKSTQHFLVPSNFVKKSLAFSNVTDDQMHLCPYGVDLSLFEQKEYVSKKENDTIEFIYVGGVKELKGIYYLLEAFKKLPKHVAHLTVVGNFNKNDIDTKEYINYVDFTGMVLHEDIPKLLKRADVFIFPSLGEGLSLSVLEAAACGLPLIVSENSGANDGMLDGEEGFIIPIQSAEAIYEKVEWFVHHRDRIQIMGEKARQFALKYTWNDYYARVKEIFQKEIDTKNE